MLPRARVPPVKTLIYKAGTGTEISKTVNKVSQLSDVDHPSLIDTDDLGIELNIDVFSGNNEGDVGGQHTQLNKTVTKKIPETYEEARNVLDKIITKKTNTVGNSYTLSELRTISKNLNLPIGNSKDTIAQTIKTSITTYYNPEC